MNLLEFHSAKEEQVREFGIKAALPGPGALTLDEAKKNIANIRKYVSLEVRPSPLAFVQSPHLVSLG